MTLRLERDSLYDWPSTFDFLSGRLLAALMPATDNSTLLHVTFVPDQLEVGGDQLTKEVTLVGFDESTLICADGHIQREDILAIEIL